MRFIVELEPPYSLDYSMSPSFVSSLYVKVKPGEWIKIAGLGGGSLKFRQVAPDKVMVEYISDAPKAEVEEQAMLELGAWHPPFEDFIHQLPSELRWAAESLSRIYPGVRLPIAPHDFNYVFISVSLSRRTSYERFVLKWCRRIWQRYNGNLEAIASASPLELREVGSSYQVAQLKVMVSDLLSIPSRLKELSPDLNIPPLTSHLDLLKLKPEEARLMLLRACRYLGPKAADSLILSCFKAPHFIPCDVHLKTLTARLGLTDPSTKMPEKSLCSRYVCRKDLIVGVKGCPKVNACLRSKLMELRGLGGWFQTLCYIHGSSICKTLAPRCDLCDLRHDCPSKP